MNGWNQVEFDVLGETGDFLAVNKPAGLLVHPTKPGGPRTLWDGLRDLLGYELATGGQVSLINRLDRETSGIVLVAKSAAAARAAGLALQRGEFVKDYLAVVFGWPDWDRTTIDAPIVRQGEVGESAVWLKRTVHPAGQPARTDCEVVARRQRADGKKFSIIHAAPVTGRTHQIRVHLAHAGHPVVGDKLYADGEQWYLRFIDHGWTPDMQARLWHPRHALHATRLRFSLDGTAYDWSAPVPGDLAGFFPSTRKDTETREESSLAGRVGSPQPAVISPHRFLRALGEKVRPDPADGGEPSSPPTPRRIEADRGKGG